MYLKGYVTVRVHQHNGRRGVEAVLNAERRSTASWPRPSGQADGAAPSRVGAGPVATHGAHAAEVVVPRRPAPDDPSTPFERREPVLVDARLGVDQRPDRME